MLNKVFPHVIKDKNDTWTVGFAEDALDGFDLCIGNSSGATFSWNVAVLLLDKQGKALATVTDKDKNGDKLTSGKAQQAELGPLAE